METFPNPPNEVEKTVSIRLSNGGFALIDEVDLPLVSQHRTWRRRDDKHTSYAFTVKRLPSVNKKAGKLKYIYMHRLILGLTDPKVVVDHKNWNGLDNRRENIRACTNAENLKNRRS